MQAGCECEKAAGVALLRWGLGFMFLIAGLNKFGGEAGAAGVSAYLAGQFAETWLPALAVKPFAYVTPYAEVVLGGLLVLGLGRRFVAPLSGLFMLGLLFGVLVLAGQNDTYRPTVFQNTVYTALFAALLMAGSWDRLTLDRLITRGTRA